MSLVSEKMQHQEFSDTKKMNPNDVARRLDNLRWSKWHTQTTILLAIGWAFDAFESSIVSAMLPNLKKYFGVTSQEAGVITTVWLIGALVGALSFGYFGDRYGRKLSFVVTICLYSLMTIITACSFHYPMFLVFRFLTAVGVGAEYTAVNATISEFIPSRHRGKVNTLVMGFWALGALVANGIQVPLVKYVDGPEIHQLISWRIGFALGGTAAIFVLFARNSLPESPRWLLVQGKYDEAEQVMMDIETASGQPDNRHNIPKVDEALERAYQSRPKMNYYQVVKELFTKYPFRVLFGMLLNGSQAFADYGVSNLMSLAVLKDSGIVGEQIPLFYLYGVLCTIPGFLWVAFLIDKIGRKILLPSIYILGIISIACFIPAYYSEDNKAGAVTGAHCFYQFAYTSIWVTVYPAFTEAFPTHLRSTGIGFAVAFGRIAAAVSPFILVGVYDAGLGKNFISACGVLFAFFGIGLLTSICWSIWGVEGRNTSLEDMNVDTADRNATVDAVSRIIS